MLNIFLIEPKEYLSFVYLMNRDILSPNKSVVFKNTASTFKGRNVYIPDISAARNDLNLQITISLRESIEEFIRLKCL